ncbi:unnamed protein product, partial [Ceratitis capitata]
HSKCNQPLCPNESLENINTTTTPYTSALCKKVSNVQKGINAQKLNFDTYICISNRRVEHQQSACQQVSSSGDRWAANTGQPHTSCGCHAFVLDLLLTAIDADAPTATTAAAAEVKPQTDVRPHKRRFTHSAHR